MTEKSEMLALANRVQRLDIIDDSDRSTLTWKERELIVSALRAAAEPVEIEFSVSTESRTAAASAEPVAWALCHDGVIDAADAHDTKEMAETRASYFLRSRPTIVPLYTHPAPVPASEREVVEVTDDEAWVASFKGLVNFNGRLVSWDDIEAAVQARKRK